MKIQIKLFSVNQAYPYIVQAGRETWWQGVKTECCTLQFISLIKMGTLGKFHWYKVSKGNVGITDNNKTREVNVKPPEVKSPSPTDCTITASFKLSKINNNNHCMNKQ